MELENPQEFQLETQTFRFEALETFPLDGSFGDGSKKKSFRIEIVGPSRSKRCCESGEKTSVVMLPAAIHEEEHSIHPLGPYSVQSVGAA